MKHVLIDIQNESEIDDAVEKLLDALDVKDDKPDDKKHKAARPDK